MLLTRAGRFLSGRPARKLHRRGTRFRCEVFMRAFLHWLDENSCIRTYLKQFDVTDGETICGAIALGYADTKDGLPDRSPLPRKEIRITRV